MEFLERTQQLYLDLQTWGPEAFHHLIVSLMMTGHLDLVQRLQPGIDLRSFFMEQVGRNVAQIHQGYCFCYCLPHRSIQLFINAVEGSLETYFGYLDCGFLGCDILVVW
jgi:hypothetical protein